MSVTTMEAPVRRQQVLAADLLRALGGQAVLLLIPRGQKGPRESRWQERTLGQQDAARLAAVDAHMRAGGNVGILLGEASGGLCAIDLDTDEAAELFLAANPKLSDSLRTRGARGCQIWAWIDGNYPDSKNATDAEGNAVAEWRASGRQSVLHGVHPSGPRYRRLVDKPPVRLRFDEIVWPPGWVLPWAPPPPQPTIASGDPEPANDGEQALTAEHGEPFTVSQRGRVTLNPPWFVARFAAECEILYEPGEARFYRYDASPGLWQPQTPDTVKIDFAADLKSYADFQEPSVREQIINARTPKFLGGLVELLRGQVERREPFAPRPGVVHVANGMLHLDCSPPELRPFGSEYYSRNATSVAYRPDARCPRFLSELLASALDADDVSLVQRYLGSLLLGRNDAQRLLVLTGTAGGGKSTLVTVAERIVGRPNVTLLRTQHLGERFETGRFVGRTLLVGKDVAGDFLSTEGASHLKSLVGGDALDAERKGSNECFPVAGIFNVIVTTNSRLRVRLDGDADAWRRRLLLVQYARPKPEHRVADFADVLMREESEGILAWMVEGACAHLAELRAQGDYTLTERQRARVNALLDESDSVRGFVRERTQPEPGEDVTVEELASAYIEFCDQQGWEPLPGRRVETALADTMLELRRTGRRNDVRRDGRAKRGFVGVALLAAGGEGAR